jgi:hypothetical protein
MKLDCPTIVVLDGLHGIDGSVRKRALIPLILHRCGCNAK